MSEHLDALILKELQAIRKLLENKQHANSAEIPPLRPIDPLPTRTPSERDDEIAAQRNVWQHPATMDIRLFEAHDHGDEQPPPPPLPTVTVRTKWTPKLEQIIHDCASAQSGSYKNSVKRLTDKLPSTVSLASIKGKCSRLGYGINRNHLYIKGN